MFGLIILSAVVNCHLFLTRGLDMNNRGQIYCKKDKNYKKFVDVWTNIYILSYSIGPSLVIATCNAALIYKVSFS